MDEQVIERLKAKRREARDRYMREFGLDEDNATHVVFTVQDIDIDDREVWAAAWNAVRTRWPEGEKTGDRLVALLLHALAVAVDGGAQA